MCWLGKHHTCPICRHELEAADRPQTAPNPILATNHLGGDMGAAVAPVPRQSLLSHISAWFRQDPASFAMHFLLAVSLTMLINFCADYWAGQDKGDSASYPITTALVSAIILLLGRFFVLSTTSGTPPAGQDQQPS